MIGSFMLLFTQRLFYPYAFGLTEHHHIMLQSHFFANFSDTYQNTLASAEKILDILDVKKIYLRRILEK